MAPNFKTQATASGNVADMVALRYWYEGKGYPRISPTSF